ACALQLRRPRVPLAALAPIVGPEQDEAQRVRHRAHVDSCADTDLVPSGLYERLIQDGQAADDAQAVERHIERRVRGLLAAVQVANEVSLAERVIDELVALLERRDGLIEPVVALPPYDDFQMQRERHAFAN